MATLARTPHAPRADTVALAVAGTIGMLAVSGLVQAVIIFAGLGAPPWWFRGLAVSVGVVVACGGTITVRRLNQTREIRRLSPPFAPAIARALIRRAGQSSLGASRRLVTVLCTDLHGFLSCADTLAPEQVARLLAEYRGEVMKLVFKYKGTLEMSAGDSLTALYNAPIDDNEHAVNAVRAALDIQERTLELAAHWHATTGVPVRARIGIDTGQVIVGMMGSGARVEYTAIGDTVSHALQLRSLSVKHKAVVVITEATYRYVEGRFLTRELGEATLRDTAPPARIYAVMPDEIRKHPRTALEAGARLDRLGGGSAHVTTRDISEGGLAVSGVPEDWAVGTLVLIRCEGHWLRKPLGAAGTIVWRRGSEAGILFRALDPAALPGVAERAVPRR